MCLANLLQNTKTHTSWRGKLKSAKTEKVFCRILKSETTYLPCESAPFCVLHQLDLFWFSSFVQLWVAKVEGVAAERPCHCPSLCMVEFIKQFQNDR